MYICIHTHIHIYIYTHTHMDVSLSLTLSIRNFTHVQTEKETTDVCEDGAVDHDNSLIRLGPT